jgi:hypothetical protein
MGKRGPPPGTGGRPRAEIDLAVVKRAAALGCTNGELAVIAGVSPRAFSDHLRQDPDMRQALDEGRDVGRTTLRRLQWQLAEAGHPTMLIWLGKQLLGQRDKADIDARVAVGGIDAPPRPSTIEDAEQWLIRRRKELAALDGPPLAPAQVEPPREPPAPHYAPPHASHEPPHQPRWPEPRWPSQPPPPRPQTPATWTAEQEAGWRRREEQDEQRREIGFRMPRLPR